MYDLERFSEKLLEAGYPVDSPVHSAVLDALVALQQHPLTDDESDAASDLLSTYAKDELGKFPSYGDDDWQEFDYGNVKPGEYIRVRKDSYDSASGFQHNGLVGVLTAMSGHRCTVRYLGRPDKQYQTHPMKNLESLRFDVKWKTKKNNKGD